ncbi:MAG: hypothetical protein K9N35_05935 [Candidatus Marinimicrobia bacterium]|nr:hypothetical protein [Candidatus Neomarinimicrobiota bacterium]
MTPVRLVVMVLVIFSLVWNCSDPGGLEAVSGVQGSIQFNPTWPDSIKSAVVVIFNKDLNLDSLNAPGYSVTDHYVTFGDPIDPGTENADYFIQLKPGDYQGMVIGLIVEPSQLLTNDEMFQNIQDYIVVPGTAIPRGIRILEKQVNEQTGWYVRF